MRAGMLAVALTAGLAPGIHAQTTPETARETARQAEVPRTEAAASLQAYALSLQDAESRLARAKDAAARGPEQIQQGALPHERGELAQAGQAALRSLENVPPDFAGTEAYRRAERRFRQSLAAFGASQPLDRERGIDGAEEALRALAELRRQVARAATAAGGPIAAPPAATGGGPTR
jgi:hypothetical protein